MVMKVVNINNVFFRGKENKSTPSGNITPNSNSIRELSNVTPDFKVNLPTPYKKLGVTQLDNGLTIHSYKLANGYKVSVVPMEGSPAVVKNYVNVGSMNETADIKGISHFLEHMAFNGTNGENGHVKLNVGDSFKKKFPFRGGEFFRVVQPRNLNRGVEDTGGGDDGTRERSAPRFVNAAHDSVSRFMCRAFKRIVRHVNSPFAAGFREKSCLSSSSEIHREASPPSDGNRSLRHG